MNRELTEYFRFIHRIDGYPPIRAIYSRLERIESNFEGYIGYMFDPDFGSGWEYVIEAIDYNFEPWTGANGSFYYEIVTAGISKSLCGAYEAVRGALPKEAWPFISHQLLGRRESFYFAYEFEHANGPDALHEEMESGWLEKFQLNEKTLNGDPPSEWEEYDE